MTEIEDKTGLVKRYQQMGQTLSEIQASAERIHEINYRQYENQELEDLASRIQQAVATLKK